MGSLKMKRPKGWGGGEDFFKDEGCPQYINNSGGPAAKSSFQVQKRGNFKFMPDK